MKRFLLALSIVLVLCLVLAIPAMAAGPQSKTWYLFNTTMTDKWSTTQLYMSTTGSPTGEVAIAAGTSKMWISNQIAMANVTFPNDAWVIRFGTDTNWGAGNFVVKIGYWDGTIFTAFPMVGTPVFYANNYEMQFQSVPSIGQTIPVNTYLAVVVTNNDAATHPIFTGKWIPDTTGSQYFSCVVSPQSDPGYPLPELGAAILLGAGILGLGGFMIVRRRQAAHTA